MLSWRENGRQCRKSLGETGQREAERICRLKCEELQRNKLLNVVALPRAASSMPTLESFVVEQ